MGCVCGKSIPVVKDYEGSPIRRQLARKESQVPVARAISANRVRKVTLVNAGNGDIRIGYVDKKVIVPTRNDYYDKERQNSQVAGNLGSIKIIPKAMEAEQIAAGWPTWLVAVAKEAIRGWIPRQAESYEKLEKIGQGTYSSVYKGRDLLHNNKIVALKEVRFKIEDPESVEFMAREILILRRLDHQNIIKLEAVVTSRTSSTFYLVFEFMEHDLLGLASLPGVNFTEPQVKCYMQQLLSGLDYCHTHGVLHRDIKGSNLLIDNNGVLKIADFGLASFFDSHQRTQLTSRVVTLWYRPPELLLGATRYGGAVDLWSTGCILGELYTGRPIMPGRTEVEQLHRIFKLCGSPSDEYWRKSNLPNSAMFKPGQTQTYQRRIAETFKYLPDAAVRLMETLLSVDPSDRGTAGTALKAEYFRTEPLACEPSNLPKYPPSKEIDAKLQEEELRLGGHGYKGQKVESDLVRPKELQEAGQAPDTNAELAMSMQKRQDHPNSKSRNEYFNPREEDEAASGFRINPLIHVSIKQTRNDHPKRASYSGPLSQGAGAGRKHNITTRHDLSILSTLVAYRDSSSLKCENKLVSSATNQVGRPSEPTVFGSQQLDKNQILETKEPIMDHRQVQKEKKIIFSGPLMVPSSDNMEEFLKDHDQRFQDVSRRLRHEMRARRGRANEMHFTSNHVYNSTQNVGSRK